MAGRRRAGSTEQTKRAITWAFIPRCQLYANWASVHCRGIYQEVVTVEEREGAVPAPRLRGQRPIEGDLRRERHGRRAGAADPREQGRHVRHQGGEEGAVAFELEARQERTVGSNATVSKLLTEYLATLERLGKASTTIFSYRQHAKNNIEPTLGNVRLNKLTGHQIDTWLAGLYDKGLAPGTVRNAFNTLKGALRQGVDWGWLASNPATRARLKTPETAPSNHLSIEALRAIYDGALADEDIDMAALIVLAVWTGCRRGELVGLRWDDLDPLECTLSVQRQWRAEEGG